MILVLGIRQSTDNIAFLSTDRDMGPHWVSIPEPTQQSVICGVCDTDPTTIIRQLPAHHDGAGGATFLLNGVAFYSPGPRRLFNGIDSVGRSGSLTRSGKGLLTLA